MSASSPAPQTVGDLIQFATQQFEEASLFFGHGTDNAWDEAVALVLFVLKLPHTVSRDILSTQPSQKEKQAILDLIQQRVSTRKPLPYLTHEAYFAGLPFYVNEHVLIPRSPIAELIETQFTPWIKPDKVKRILDMGTGSACIAIACALAFPDAQVDAVDVDPACLEVAQINIKQHQLEKRVHPLRSYLFEHLSAQHYDIIVSNPPYVDQEDMDALPKEYLHEPQHALFGGTDGLDLVKIILQQAKHFLRPHGILVIEVGNSEAAIMAQFPQLPFIWPSFERGGGGVFILMAEDL
ncbi:MAG: 50S ribosomal protein L3 N(5)-glutamine methyltransferase [Gammaproteobacteria bacterium]|nr:50S ribosomal protein L3 N(5)-glutamine methyltransferase [Gammaproteobacteria bacterium]